MRRRIRVERSLPILKCRVPRILSLHECSHIVQFLRPECLLHMTPRRWHELQPRMEQVLGTSHFDEF